MGTEGIYLFRGMWMSLLDVKHKFSQEISWLDHHHHRSFLTLELAMQVLAFYANMVFPKIFASNFEFLNS